MHCIGPHASDLVHLGQAVMSHEGDLSYFVEAVFNYPTLGEVYKHAAFEALERMRERATSPGWSQWRRSSGYRPPPGAGAAAALDTLSSLPLGSRLGGTGLPLAR